MLKKEFPSVPERVRMGVLYLESIALAASSATKSKQVRHSAGSQEDFI